MLSTVISLANFAKKHIKSLLVIADILAILLAFFSATVLKFDEMDKLPEWYRTRIVFIVLVDIVATIASFIFTHIYSRMWQYFVAGDYFELFLGTCISKTVTFAVFFTIWTVYTREFMTWMALYFMIFLFFVMLSRTIVLSGYHLWRKKVIAGKRGTAKKKNVMIIGAGGAASRLIKELRSSTYVNRYNVVALIDDNKRKIGEYLDGVRVCGNRNDIVSVAEKYRVDEIFIAVPSASEQNKKELLSICVKTGCVLKTLPAIVAVDDKGKLGGKLRKVNYADLLGREQIKPDLTQAFELLKGHTVLVTGGGGSIGGELVRQVAKSGVAKRIIIFDIAENGAYEIQQEVRRKYPNVDLRVMIGSVRDEKRLDEVFTEYKPSFVYHAAAHKHVPLMEDSPKEAVKNNVFGTYNLAKTADRHHVKRFVMISTDKAVNPTNVMGATKRICEMIVQSFNKSSATEFVCVRFGNVLGSNGSVIPLFKEQIEAGGPVTVTHPDIIRYFMLIPEAVSLVLQAGAFAKGGEVFILDMGSPVKIRELAENLIRLSGHVPGEDIEIKYTGLREGEKLYEELLISEEGIQKTQNNLIYVARPMEIDSEGLFKKLDEIRGRVDTLSRPEMIDWVKALVPTFTPKNTEYKEAKEHEDSTEEK